MSTLEAAVSIQRKSGEDGSAQKLKMWLSEEGEGQSIRGPSHGTFPVHAPVSLISFAFLKNIVHSYQSLVSSH